MSDKYSAAKSSGVRCDTSIVCCGELRYVHFVPPRGSINYILLSAAYMLMSNIYFPSTDSMTGKEQIGHSPESLNSPLVWIFCQWSTLPYANSLAAARQFSL